MSTAGTALADCVPVGLAAVDLSGRQTYVNGHFARLVGREISELVGATAPFVYWPETERDAIASALERTTRGDAPVEGFDLRFCHRDGRLLDVRVTVAPLRTEAGCIGWVSAVLDTSEARTAQAAVREQDARLRLALEAGRLGAWEYDLHSGRVQWSETLERIHGLEPGTFGGDFEAYQRDIHPEDRVRVLETIARSAQGLGAHHLEYRIVWPDGSTRWLEAHGTLLREADGEPVRMVGVCTDVTDRKHAEAAIRVAKDQADQANRAKAEFLASMSHELRTPLNAIGGYVDLIDLEVHGPVTERQRSALARIRHNQQHLLRLINDVLHFARIDAGRLELEVAPFPMGAVVDSLDAVIGPQAAAKQLNYRCTVSPDSWCLADRERVEQILINLVTNAIKYTPAGGAITLEAATHEGRVVVTVADTGCGIAPEWLETIFDPFVQAQQRAARDGHGVGLGLAISRELAVSMGGTLTAQSEPGRGSTFTLHLPAPAPDGLLPSA